MNQINLINEQIAQLLCRIKLQQKVVDSIPDEQGNLSDLIYDRLYLAECTILDGYQLAYKELLSVKTKILNGDYKND